MADELDETVYSEITAFCAEGDALAEEGNYDQAIVQYEAALRLVPTPVTDWEAATWILTSIGEACYFKGDYTQALEVLQEAMRCPDAIGNPFIHLRLGQVQFELRNLPRATDELVRAYMGAGEEIFADEDAKYLALVKASIKET
jgi:tetratricopeptide (TPR) repeat protein